MIILKMSDGQKDNWSPITIQHEEKPEKKIYPRDLKFTWGDNPSYWKLPEQSQNGPAELKRVCWLQVTGTTQVETGKSYIIKFNVTLNPGAFGWNGLPLFLIAKTHDGNYTWQMIDPLKPPPATGTGTVSDIPTDGKQFTVQIPPGVGKQELFFGLYEIWSNRWKGGLLINYASVKERSSPN
ncbi:protein PHLOEM PROTEIN 2-LIKE A9-like [Pistacia vera]|uniref:protein PHLOEM PROTEIN 2-LIKE A9-like n=1 Tax=Pistacia vera TaxID=55513 RepID=UPI00126310B2|nr:protein PHLOEM PROTEIN 2-LIKE A9-like [Pistacia vera]